MVIAVANVRVCNTDNEGSRVVAVVLTTTGVVVCRTGFWEVETGAGVFVGAAVWNVCRTAGVETLTGALVATCSGAIYTGRNGKKYPPVASRYPSVSSSDRIFSFSARAVHGTDIMVMVKIQNRRNRIRVLRAGARTGGWSAVIHDTISLAL
jgi:hypothetical protein